MLSVFGLCAVAIFGPIAAIFILLTALEAAVMVIIFARLDRASGWRKWGTYLILPNLLFVDFNETILGLPVATIRQHGPSASAAILAEVSELLHSLGGTEICAG